MVFIKFDNDDDLKIRFSFKNDLYPKTEGHTFVSRGFTSEKMGEVEMLYGRGLTTPKIAKILGVSVSTVCNWLNKVGVERAKHISLENLSSYYLQEILKDKQKFYHLARILGYLKSDGFIGESGSTYSVGFSQRHDRIEVLKDFRISFERVFGLSPSMRIQTGGTFKGHPVTTLYACSKAVVLLLKKFGKFGCYDWDLNFDVEIGDKEFWSNLLQTLFEGDGGCSVYIDKYSGKQRKKYFINSIIGLSSVTDKGLQNVKNLLEQKFQLPARITKGKNYFKLLIASKKNLQRFKENINFASRRKKIALEVGVRYMYEAFRTKEGAEKFLDHLRRGMKKEMMIDLPSTKTREKQRNKILALLAEKPRINRELREILQISRKTVHKHLRKMETSGLIKRVGKKGTAILYDIAEIGEVDTRKS